MRISLADPMDIDFNTARHFTFTPVNFETPYCFSVSIEDDEVVEDQEDFTLSLTSSDVDVLVKKDSHTVFIVDNDCELSGAYDYSGTKPLK